jgi:putative transposase
MLYDPDVHHRRSIRLKGFDYSSVNAYFVTVCVEKRRCQLGEIANSEMVLNECGKVVVECWTDLPNHYSNIQLDQYVVMPNHFHGIIQIGGVELKADSVLPERAGYKPAPTDVHVDWLKLCEDLKYFRLAGSIQCCGYRARLSGSVIITNM